MPAQGIFSWLGHQNDESTTSGSSRRIWLNQSDSIPFHLPLAPLVRCDSETNSAALGHLLAEAGINNWDIISQSLPTSMQQRCNQGLHQWPLCWHCRSNTIDRLWLGSGVLWCWWCLWSNKLRIWGVVIISREHVFVPLAFGALL